MKRSLRWLKEMQRLVFLLLLTVVTFSYAMFQGGFVSWFLFYSFLPFAVYALCLSLYPLADFTVERIFVQREFFAGDTVKVKLWIKRQRRFPLVYLVVEDEMDEAALGNADVNQSQKVFFPGFKREFQVEYSIEELPRGELQLKGVRIKTGDLLGLIEKEQYISIEDKILVYPAYEILYYRQLENRLDQGTSAANEQIQRDSSMTVGVRQYQPGDRFSWINWKATARRNEFMTKEFEQRTSHDVMVVMDCSPNPNFEAVVSYTASITRAILVEGAQVGFLASSDIRVVLPIRGGERQRAQLFHHLAKIKSLGVRPFAEILAGEAQLMGQANTLMLITANFTQDLVDQLNFFSRNKGTLMVFIVKGKHEPPTELEQQLVENTRPKGFSVTVVHEGEFAKPFSEVNGK